MRTEGRRKSFGILGSGLALLLTLWGCASLGSPSGGPRDEDPPRFVAASPRPGSVNVDPSQINIDFNELVNVKDAFEKVILSPPGASAPRVSTRGRRVIVSITDTLLENTTYTIDFGDAIEDNNEGNKLSGFAYTFSTGPDLDSLRISGMVLGAEDLEPQQGVFVGAYVSQEDSAFLKTPFHRLARTDEYGRFVIRGLQDTTYRLFALKDLDNDKHYANPEEDIAFYDALVRPYAERITASDTIRDLFTGAVDTVVTRERTKFMPNNILLRMFNTRVRPQYLVDYSRPDSTQLKFIFNAPSVVAPRVVIAGEDDYMAPLKPERTVGNDTLTFWLPPSLASRDTLQLALRFTRTDVLTGVESVANDTVKLMKPKVVKSDEKDRKKKKKSKKLGLPGKTGESAESGESGETAESGVPVEANDSLATSEKSPSQSEEERPPVPTFAFKATGPDTDLSAPLLLEVPVPLSWLDSLAFRLEIKPDSVWIPVKEKYRLERLDTLSERRFKIDYPWERGMTYRILADSLAATDLYGVQSEKLELEFRTKPVEELSNLKLTMTGLDPDVPAFVQLLSSDNPKYKTEVKDGVALFEGIDPGKYYARVYEDRNGDGVYTPGTYRQQRVFGEPVEEVRGEGLEIDTIGSASDSLNIVIADSIPTEKVHPLSNLSPLDSLRAVGYSFVPLETDSVGIDILIAEQPDLVFYFPKIINVKKNWDVEQSWNVFETAVDLQKPAKIKKNKPKRTNGQREASDEDEEDEDDEFGGNMFNNNSNRNSGRGNMNNNRVTAPPRPR